MKDLSRFLQLSILAVFLFLALLAAWAVAAYHSPLAWFALVVTAFLFLSLAAIVAVDVVQDAQIKSAEHRLVMQRAGYVFIDGRWWAWDDADGDGEIDAGELRRPDIVTIRTRQEQEGDTGFRICREVLVWCYEREAAGLSWGQVPGCTRFGQSGYEYALAVFKAMALVEDRSQGKQGRLVYPRHADALATLRERWAEGGGKIEEYVKPAAY